MPRGAGVPIAAGGGRRSRLAFTYAPVLRSPCPPLASWRCDPRSVASTPVLSRLAHFRRLLITSCPDHQWWHPHVSLARDCRDARPG
jgi:hypothetical protein